MLTRIRTAIVLVLAAGLAVSAYAGYRLYTEEPEREAPVARVTGTTDDGWRQVTYRGVTVELPPEWARLDADMCIGFTEHWGPSDMDPCADDAGVWFLESDDFDAETGPGVHTTRPSLYLPDGGWGGYVTRGDVVVSTAAVDQAVVRRILRSVSEQV